MSLSISSVTPSDARRKSRKPAGREQAAATDYSEKLETRTNEPTLKALEAGYVRNSTIAKRVEALAKIDGQTVTAEVLVADFERFELTAP